MTNLSLKKTVCRLVFAAMIFSTMLLSSGCEKKTAASDPTSQSTPGSTKLLEAVDLVGYDGKRLRKSVDRIKETNEKHNQELEKMAGSGPDQ
jgi:outer membrane murein-binding lipoprotein Lpp